MIKYIAALTPILFCSFSFSDVVPYSIESVGVRGGGYLELIGPGLILLGKETTPYSNKKYIRTSSIGTLSSMKDKKEGCIIEYSSEGYTQSITVLKQNCDDVLTVIRVSKRMQ